MLKLLLIFLGAGTGGVLRYGLGGLVQGWMEGSESGHIGGGAGFPWGTLAVNVSGCLVMGFLAAAWCGWGNSGGAAPGPWPVRDEVRAAVLIGVLGGYTTFSSFGRETLVLMHEGQWLRAGVYVAASIVLSLLAVWLGSAAAARVLGAGSGAGMV